MADLNNDGVDDDRQIKEAVSDAESKMEDAIDDLHRSVKDIINVDGNS